MSAKKLSTLLILASLGLSACSDDDEPMTMMPPDPDPVMISYDVTVTNLTHAHPLSPLAVILHQNDGFWAIGEMASPELEMLAESGDNSQLIAMADAMVSASGTGLIMPGNSETVSITIEDVDDANLTIASMLANTNDGFTGLNGLALGELAIGGSWSGVGFVYDAGTEANTEAMGSIVGPADGGEGFSEIRDDVNYVAMHPGIVSMDDGLSTSVLTQAHRFDNPAMKVVITRTE
ncbi:spondin domain-containing protein [Alteromonadaceae bacterium BrNp21-10]|nr:spondin domain-containing protein [Alteromonadaceae bacterium BrNp21-10]